MGAKLSLVSSAADPFNFGQPDPESDPFHETDPETELGSKKSAKIMENIHQNQPKSQEYLT